MKKVQPKKIKKLQIITINNRVNKMRERRRDYLENIENIHVKLQKGNNKTGSNCWTVSLIPILDCNNCFGCKMECYDIINVCFQPAVQNDRARNSAIHLLQPDRYWREISAQIKENCVTQLRVNVGGDLTYTDFFLLNNVAKENPKTDILFFTKNYKGINMFLDGHEFESNVHPIVSAWKGTKLENPHNLPVSHVLYVDGSTTAPEFGSYYCGGNCSQCHFNNEGCWTLKKGESVIFPAH